MGTKLQSNFLNMALVLSMIAVLAGGLLSWVNAATFEKREQNKAARTLKAINLVGIDFDNDPMMEVLDLETGRVYVLREGEEISGYAIQARSLEGYGGLMEIMVGFNPDGLIQKTAVLSHRETRAWEARSRKSPLPANSCLLIPGLRIFTSPKTAESLMPFPERPSAAEPIPKRCSTLSRQIWPQ
jgi:hypothetical protein